MNNSFSIGFFDRALHSSLRKGNDKVSQDHGRGLLIEKGWLRIRYGHTLGLFEEISVEIASMMTQHTENRKDAKDQLKLSALMRAVMPAVLDYRTALLALDGATRSAGDYRANAVLLFECGWLENRIKEVFGLTKDLPISQIPRAAAAFDANKPQAMIDALAVNGHILKMFSIEAITPAMCLSAVTTTPSALQHVPGRLLTKGLCRSAIATKKTDQFGLLVISPLEHIPIALRDQAMCKAAVTANGMALQHVPTALKTENLCVLACLENGLAWEFVPEQMRSLEVEFCTALHGFHHRDCDQVCAQMHAENPAHAQSAADKYQTLFLEMHYPQASADELSDMGWDVPCQ